MERQLTQMFIISYNSTVVINNSQSGHCGSF